MANRRLYRIAGVFALIVTLYLITQKDVKAAIFFGLFTLILLYSGFIAND